MRCTKEVASAPGRCAKTAIPGSRPITDDERLGISGARALGIVRRWSCGCAEMLGGIEQPALTCAGGDQHKRQVVQGRGAQGKLF